jgi:hypothetical protein
VLHCLGSLRAAAFSGGRAASAVALVICTIPVIEEGVLVLILFVVLIKEEVVVILFVFLQAISFIWEEVRWCPSIPVRQKMIALGGNEGGPHMFANIEVTVKIGAAAVKADLIRDGTIYPDLVGCTALHYSVDGIFFAADRLDSSAAEIVPAPG